MENKTLRLRVPPEVGMDTEALRLYIAQTYQMEGQAFGLQLLRRSVDARKRPVLVDLEVLIVMPPRQPEPLAPTFQPRNISAAPPVLIAGSGPAGLFAALRLIELGLKPILFERGKDVQSRRRDLAAINKHNIVNPESNYCFGEGGAGTYSDGKLYTRSTKRGDVRRILGILHQHGARDEILYDAHPHIGTNKLPQLVQALRQAILACGGEIHFNTRVDDLVLDSGECRGVVLHDGTVVEGLSLILATGHSARDIFELLHRRGVAIEAKPFAMGVRIEHRQKLIDQIQYKMADRGPHLPASSYSLVSQQAEPGGTRGVFSFCMCPGGFIVPAATGPEQVVVNGMSPSKRDSRFANSGIVVAIDPADWAAFAQDGPLAGLRLQQQLEKLAWEAAGQTQQAPAQRMKDFMEGKPSTSLLDASYLPGLTLSPLHKVLPDYIRTRLQGAFRDFGKKMPGYLTNDAQIVGVESRSSSPVRIPRHPENCEHVQVKRLFPCAEGAGYAGGIVSAAMDGERCAEAAARLYS